MFAVLQSVLPLITGFIGGIVKLHLEAKAEQQKLLITRAGLEEKSRRRAASIKDEKVSWTRRTIALIFTIGLFLIIGAILAVGIFSPDTVINVPKEGFRYNLLSIIGITSPKEVVDYVQLSGVAIVMPLVEPIIAAVQVIVGFYFGSARTK